MRTHETVLKNVLLKDLAGLAELAELAELAGLAGLTGLTGLTGLVRLVWLARWCLQAGQAGLKACSRNNFG